MSKAIGVLGAGLGIVGAVAFYAAAQGARTEDRIDGLERAVRSLERSAGGARGPAPSMDPLRAQIESLEQRIHELQRAVAARPAGAAPSLHDPAAGSPAFQEGVRKVFGRIREEEQADLLIYNRGEKNWRVVSDFIGMDEAQAAALQPIFAEMGARVKAFRDQSLEGDGDVLSAVRAKDAELGRAAYAQVKSVLKPSQWAAAKKVLLFGYADEGRNLLDEWESISNSLRRADDIRPGLEDAIRKLHEAIEQSEGKPGAADLLRAKDHEVRLALVDQLQSRLPLDRMNALRATLGLPTIPVPKQEPPPAPATGEK